jgi:vacuolar-type H+-ATPase subunit I/STV1
MQASMELNELGRNFIMDETTTTSTGAQDTAGTAATNAAATTATQTQNGATGEASASQGNAQQQETKTTDLENLIQRAVDRATNKLGNENKKLREQVEALKKEKLSDEEIKQLEIKEREKEIAEREQRLQEKENRLLAIKAIKEIGLDDGSDASLALVDFVMAEDEAAIKERVKTFDALVKRFVQAQVDKVFKANGRTPGVGSTATGDTGRKADSVAVRIGQRTANANKQAQSTLDYYIGGKKK